MKNKKTNFIHGFNVKGKRTTDVGEDLIGTYVATEDNFDEPTYEGTPVDLEADKELDITADGEYPDALLFDRVADELTDLEWMTGEIGRDEVPAGNPATVVLFKPGAVIETELQEGLTAGDDVEVDGGEFATTDSGEVVGKCVDVEDGIATIVLK